MTEHRPTTPTGLTLGIFLLVMMAFMGTTAYAVALYRMSANQPLRNTAYESDWICAPGAPSHAGYFRKRFDLTSEVKHAWVKIVAADAYEISVNRNPMGRIYLWRPTRPFQTGTSEKGQVLQPNNPAMALNFPREYQWDGHDTWRLPSYIELTSSFQVGKNVITIETESRSAPARVSFVGEIQLYNGKVIPLRSDESWSSEPAIPGPQLLDWTELGYWDKEWRHAKICDGPADSGYRSHPEEIYREPFRGNWMRHPKASNKASVSYAADWMVDRPIDEAWIRLMTNRNYELQINGELVRVASIKPPDLDNGEWVFGRASAFDPSAKPELLDPDEVGSNFVGTRFESPRKGHRNLGEFRNPYSPALTPFRYIRTYNRAQAPGEWDPKRTLAESRRTPETPDLFPERPRPNALKHDTSVGGYLSYSIANLLQPGMNRVEVFCLDKSNAIWPTQIAVDGGALADDGTRIDFVDNERWRTHCDREIEVYDGANGEVPVRVLGPVLSSGKAAPKMQYRGNALSPQQLDILLPQAVFQVSIITLIGVFIVVLGSLIVGRSIQEDETPVWQSTCQMIYAMLLTATVTIGCGLLLESSWAERHESLWTLRGEHWKVVFPFAIFASLLVGLLDIIGRSGFAGLRKKGHSVFDVLRDLPKTKLWFHLCLWVLLLGVFLRAYKLDLQPLDDDEYASAQAVMAILETGSPGFVPDDVYYTRSPLYHYATAAIAWPFGGNLWSLRLQSVMWSIGTAWLAYLAGARLLQNRWVGFVTMVLICVHPFEIFTGHVIRFYQMQQFFALLTVYLFCRGFVTEQSQGYRVATLIAFLCAVVSQEISVAMGPSLLFGYLMFAKDLGWKNNFTLVLVSASVVALIGLDFVVFQNLCLTRTEGVSPSIEAAVKPHFWYPMNMLSMLFGYSRLHVVVSFFFVAGLPLIWREQNRNALALLAFLISGIVMTNLLVTNVSFRYLYWLIPIWLLLSVDSVRLVISTLVSIVYPVSEHLNRHASTLAVCFFVCFVAIIASWSPWRIPGSYELRILGDSTGAVRWVRSQKRAGDRVAITEPHTHCAYMEGGKCDYDLALPLLYDFAVMRDGKLVDRNGGGEVLSNVDQLVAEFADGERIWVLLNREKFRTRGKNMRWEYPGARFEMFVRKNCELKYRTYLWSVYLWDPSRGHFQPFRLQE
ncbi:ArnT family glycosyltransferase [Mariniblastus fucicola]|uniref:Glycosyltransferase RgtA/B/C/D-like domain-containing protein n=1 Tax=Mariniblastus fucicola TaxID=980251 RepID=A0A5B9PD65_9BACT|nr:glycosyltransferase family 39 protein [Mariniblastus fucicola]QEG23030.1 hypothetical protein MFFC18_29220 [Mariniblastus fucicola]